MDSAQKQLTDKITSANNILVTVSRNPSVDQLAACIGLTLLLNKLDKHATAVFSGAVPSTIEFLKPEGTLEKNTDSLRDFIIALDKSKADKLRYKVEDQLVRIFITPYRTSISQSDLDFSQGDFNVDLVIALGVAEQADLDDAITSHGRILHDATVSSMNASASGTLGSINLNDPRASSLCELVVELAHSLGQGLLDGQTATALLTGIVAETKRFSNEKTTSQTMSVSAELLAAGADQQLVASKLQQQLGQSSSAPSEPHNNGSEPPDAPAPPAATPPVPPKSDDGTLEIEHNEGGTPNPSLSDAPPDTTENALPIVEGSAEPTFSLPKPADTSETEPAQGEENDRLSPGPKLVVDPPLLGGTLTANSRPEPLEAAIDPLGLSTEPARQLLDRSATQPSAPNQATSSSSSPSYTPAPPTWQPPSASDTTTPSAAAPSSNADALQPPATVETTDAPMDNTTLSAIEETVNSPHLQTQSVESARDEVMKALNDIPAAAPEPIQALNAQPLGEELHPEDLTPPQAAPVAPTDFVSTLQQTIPATSASAALPIPADPQATLQQTPTAPLSPVPPADTTQPTAQAEGINPNAAPPVPPPIPYHFGNTT